MGSRKQGQSKLFGADGMGGLGNSGREGGENLRTATGGQLNPTWVELLMGFPENVAQLFLGECPLYIKLVR